MISLILRVLKVAAFLFGAVAVSGAIRQAGGQIAEAIDYAGSCHCEGCEPVEGDEDGYLLDDVDVELDEDTAAAFDEIAGELSDLDEAGDALAAEHDVDECDELDDTDLDDDEFVDDEEIEGDAP